MQQEKDFDYKTFSLFYLIRSKVLHSTQILTFLIQTSRQIKSDQKILFLACLRTNFMCESTKLRSTLNLYLKLNAVNNSTNWKEFYFAPMSKKVAKVMRGFEGYIMPFYKLVYPNVPSLY